MLLVLCACLIRSRLPDWSNLILCRCFSPPLFFIWFVKQGGYWSLETRKTIEHVVWASGLNQISSWTPITVCWKLRRDHNSEMTDDSCWIKHMYCRRTRPKSVRLKTPYSIKTKIIDSDLWNLCFIQVGVRMGERALNSWIGKGSCGSGRLWDGSKNSLRQNGAGWGGAGSQN